MFTLTIAFCLAGELPALDTCRAETLPVWFTSEEACVLYLNTLNNSRFMIFDAECRYWASAEGLTGEPA